MASGTCAARSRWPELTSRTRRRAQFYINVNDNRSLDPQPDRWGYAVFGYVIEGMDVVDRLPASGPARQGQFSQGRAAVPIIIKKASRYTVRVTRFSFQTCTCEADRPDIARPVPAFRRDRGAATPMHFTSSATCSNPGSATTIPTSITRGSKTAGASEADAQGHSRLLHARQSRLHDRRGICRRKPALKSCPTRTDRKPLRRAGAPAESWRCVLH